MKNSKIGARLKITHFAGKERVYEVNFMQEKYGSPHVDNYQVTSTGIDIFSQDLDTFS